MKTHNPSVFTSEVAEFFSVALFAAIIGFRDGSSVFVGAGASSEVAVPGISVNDGVVYLSSQYGRLAGSHSAGLFERSWAVCMTLSPGEMVKQNQLTKRGRQHWSKKSVPCSVSHRRAV